MATGTKATGERLSQIEQAVISTAKASVHRVEINGVRLFYRRAGAGELVLLVHGFPETSYAWRRVVPLLAERYTVIAPDLRGCGASDRPESGYDKRTVAADLHELVRRLGFDRVNIVSHDVGMMVGYAYACAYPETVRRVVLMEAALPGLGLEELYDGAKCPRMYHLPLFEAPNGFAEALIAGRERLFVEHFMRQQAYNQDGIEPEALDEYARCLAAPGALRGGIGYFRAHKLDAEHNRENAKTKLAMPLMTVSGIASAGDALKGAVQPLAEQLRHVTIEECGHYIAEEQPARLAEELLKFFAN